MGEKEIDGKRKLTVGREVGMEQGVVLGWGRSESRRGKEQRRERERLGGHIGNRFTTRSTSST